MHTSRGHIILNMYQLLMLPMWAHSRGAAGPSDTGLDPSGIEGQKKPNCLEL